jgi:hypothetical protein
VSTKTLLPPQSATYGDPLAAALEEVEPAQRLVLQHDDDAAGVGVRAQAPHQLPGRGHAGYMPNLVDTDAGENVLLMWPKARPRFRLMHSARSSASGTV